MKKGSNFIHFNPNAAYPNYSRGSEARKAIPYPRDNPSDVNKDEPFNRLFSRRTPGDSGDLLLILVEARKVEARMVVITSQNSVSVLSIQVAADIVSTASSIMSGLGIQR